MKRITEEYLLSLGFKITSQCSVWIDYTNESGLTVSTEMSINAGGFNIKGTPINYEHELHEYLKQNTHKHGSNIQQS